MELAGAHVASMRELRSLQVHSEHLKGGLGPICAAGHELRLNVVTLRTGVLEDMSGLKHF